MWYPSLQNSCSSISLEAQAEFGVNVDLERSAETGRSLNIKVLDDDVKRLLVKYVYHQFLGAYGSGTPLYKSIGALCPMI